MVGESIANRRDEIEQKRARLRQLRQQREQRESLRHSIGGHGLEQPTSPTSSLVSNSRHELDTLITSLVGDGRSVSIGAASPGSQSRPISVASAQPDGSRRQKVCVSTQTDDKVGGGAVHHFGTGTAVYAEAAPPRRAEAPANRVRYSKGVQTAEELLQSVVRPGDDDDDDDDTVAGSFSTGGKKKQLKAQREKEEQMRQSLRREIEAELKTIYEKPSGTAGHRTSEPMFPGRDLTDDEVNAITGSDEFMEFIDRSTKVIERALDQEYDILADYAVTGDGDGTDDDDGNGARRSRRMKEIGHFWDSRWSARRMMSDLSFSPKFPELVVASYTKNPGAPHDPDGIVQVWNLHMHDRPEYVFQAQSDILTVRFSPFHPHLILGGCYSGQVVVWDSRAGRPGPVQKTPLTGIGHAHPVYALELVGTQNANNIISASTDGTVCSWSVNMLSQPQEYLELTNPHGTKTDEFAPTCIAFPTTDPTYFLAGSEEGVIVPCQRYDRAGAKAGIDPRTVYRGHTAPVTGLSFHPAHGPADLGDLVLSSALDWSVRLWRARPPAADATPTPLLEFARDDLVYDVKWSPVRPAVFALVDGAGSLEVWDLNFDAEVPAASVKPGELRRRRPHKAGTSPGTSSGVNLGTLGSATTGPTGSSTNLSIPGAPTAPAGVSSSLHRLAWEPTTGSRIAAGGLDGVVSVFEVGSQLGGTDGQKAEEWAGMKRLVARAEQGWYR